MLPVGVLAAVGAAGVARYARSAVADALSGDFVRTARAKGLAPGAVFGKHALAVALPPLVVLLALSLPGIVAGSVFVESVFAWPGLGSTIVSAIQMKDYPVAQATVLVYGALVLIINTIIDWVLAVLDPRTTLADS